MAGLSNFLKTVSMDLQASTARQGFVSALAALIFEPGFAFLFCYRVAVYFYSSGFRRLGMILWRRNSIHYGCYLHIHADIAGGLKLPHPVGVVVGEGVEIGEWVTLYQGVTLGQGSAQKSYPSIGDKATIFTNAVVLGAIRVGAGAVIGAGSLVNRHVANGAVVAGNPAKPIRQTLSNKVEEAAR